MGLRRAEFEHTVQDVARQAHLHSLGARLPTSEPTSEESLVAEEGILGAGLAVIARLLLPLASSDVAPDPDAIAYRPDATVRKPAILHDAHLEPLKDAGGKRLPRLPTGSHVKVGDTKLHKGGRWAHLVVRDAWVPMWALRAKPLWLPSSTPVQRLGEAHTTERGEFVKIRWQHGVHWIEAAKLEEFDLTYATRFGDERMEDRELTAGVPTGLIEQRGKQKNIRFERDKVAKQTFISADEAKKVGEIAGSLRVDTAIVDPETGRDLKPRRTLPMGTVVLFISQRRVGRRNLREVELVASGDRYWLPSGRIKVLRRSELDAEVTDPRIRPHWTRGSTQHATAYTRNATPDLNARFVVGNNLSRANISTVTVRVKEGATVLGTTAPFPPGATSIHMAGLALTGLSGSAEVRSSNYTLTWEASVNGGTTWGPITTTGVHPVYWLHAAPHTAPLFNFAVAKATGYIAGAATIAASIRTGLRGDVNYDASDPINPDPLSVYVDGIGICTDFANLLTLLARSVGFAANSVMFWGGFESLGKNIWVTLGGAYGHIDLVNVRWSWKIGQFAKVYSTG